MPGTQQKAQADRKKRGRLAIYWRLKKSAQAAPLSWRRLSKTLAANKMSNERKDVMSNINQIIANSSHEYKNWYNKNKWLIKILGMSCNDAAFQKGNIDGIINDIQSFYKSTKKFAAVTLMMLAILCLSHSLLFLTTTRIFNLISIYFGLIGSYLASYGFILGLQRIKSRNQDSTIWMPNVPSHTEEFPRYCSKMNEIVANIINSGAHERVGQFKLELRRQFSLAIGFGLLVISFCIQIVLEFVGR